MVHARRRARAALLREHPEPEVVDDAWRRSGATGGRRREVELSGPATARLARAAAASRSVDLFMADLEDQLPPGWGRVVDAHAAILACVRPGAPVVAMRPRAWPAREPAVEVDGEPVAAAVLDVALHLSHVSRRPGVRPHVYLPKVEAVEEALAWARLLAAAEDGLGLARGAVEVSLLVETVGAVVWGDAMVLALRDRITAVNAGRWDFLFSYARLFAGDPRGALPPVAALVDGDPLLAGYASTIVDLARRRGILAVGGMTGCWPGDGGPSAAELEGVRVAKRGDAAAGFGASTIAHPALADAARQGLRAGRSARADAGAGPVGGTSLFALRGPSGPLPEAEPAARVRLLIDYLERWCAGEAPIVVGGEVQEVSTAEIARMQLWSWVRGGVAWGDGGRLEAGAVARLIDERAVRSGHPLAGTARELARRLVLAEEPPEDLGSVLAGRSVDRTTAGR